MSENVIHQIPDKMIEILLYVIMYQNPESSNLIGWKLEVGVVS